MLRFPRSDTKPRPPWRTGVSVSVVLSGWQNTVKNGKIRSNAVKKEGIAKLFLTYPWAPIMWLREADEGRGVSSLVRKQTRVPDTKDGLVTREKVKLNCVLLPGRRCVSVTCLFLLYVFFLQSSFFRFLFTSTTISLVILHFVPHSFFISSHLFPHPAVSSPLHCIFFRFFLLLFPLLPLLPFHFSHPQYFIHSFHPSFHPF